MVNIDFYLIYRKLRYITNITITYIQYRPSYFLINIDKIQTKYQYIPNTIIDQVDSRITSWFRDEFVHAIIITYTLFSLAFLYMVL